MGADPGIQADTVDDVAGRQPLGFGVGVQLIEIADPQGQIGIGEEFHGLGLGEAHEQCGDILFNGPLLQKGGEDLRLFPGPFVAGDDDPGGIQIVVQRLGFPQKFRAEKNAVRAVFFSNGSGIPHGNGGFDDHGGLWVCLQHQLNHGFYGGGIEIVFLAVIIGGGGDDDKVRISVGIFAVQRGSQVQLFFGQILFNIFVLNGGFALVDQLHLFRDNIHGSHVVVLAQQRGNGEAHIACTGYGNIVLLFWSVFGFGLCFVNEQRCDIEVQRLCQGFQLCDGWFKGSVLQLADHGAVDTRQVCKLDLRQALFLSTGFYGFGQTVEGKLLHRKCPLK